MGALERILIQVYWRTTALDRVLSRSSYELLLFASAIKEQVLTFLVDGINLWAIILHIKGFFQIIVLSVLLMVVRAGGLMLSIWLSWKLLSKRIVRLGGLLLWLPDLAWMTKLVILLLRYIRTLSLFMCRFSGFKFHNFMFLCQLLIWFLLLSLLLNTPICRAIRIWIDWEILSALINYFLASLI